MANMASACALVMSASDSAKLLGPLRYWRHRQAASTCILVTISAVCVCILVVCGVLLAREYSLAKGYERTMCAVSNVTYASAHQSCHFCSGHKDKSRDRGCPCPCVLVPRAEVARLVGAGVRDVGDGAQRALVALGERVLAGEEHSAGWPQGQVT